jgi:tripartite motif-containing protein 71
MVNSNNPNSSTIVAGTGSPGFDSTMLDSPQGIYLDSDINLYVADCGNDRIQKFTPMQSSGITIIGNGSAEPLGLDCPTAVVLDSNGYLFIVDSNNHRIVGSGPNGFRCLVGCSGTGVLSHQLSFPQGLSFDSYGNMFVTDRGNNRLQRFNIQKTSCGEYSNTANMLKDRSSCELNDECCNDSRT